MISLSLPCMQVFTHSTCFHHIYSYYKSDRYIQTTVLNKIKCKGPCKNRDYFGVILCLEKSHFNMKNIKSFLANIAAEIIVKMLCIHLLSPSFLI